MDGFLMKRELRPARLEPPLPDRKSVSCERPDPVAAADHQLQRDWIRRAAVGVLGEPSHRASARCDLRLCEANLIRLLDWFDGSTGSRRDSQLTILAHRRSNVPLGGSG